MIATSSFATIVVAMMCSAQVTVENPKLRTFVEHVDREWAGDSHQQAVTVTSLRLLADAVEAVGRRSADHASMDREIAELRAMTGEYDRGTPGDPQQSKRLRKTLLGASQIVARTVTAAGLASRPDPRLSAMQRAARSLDDDAPLRRQPDVLERFFQHAAEALRRFDGT